MINFEYENKTKLIFGKGKHKEIGALIKPIVIKYYYIMVVEVLKKVEYMMKL